MKKKIPLALGAGIAILLMSGCQGNGAVKETEAVKMQTESVSEAAANGNAEEAAQKGTVYEAGGWKVTFEDVITEQKLENVSTQLGYTDVSTSEYHKQAGEGMKFCMIKLVFEKIDSKEEIDFEKLKLKDENGKEYSRMEDAFISDLGMKRLQGTKLNFGTNEGWICYEVEESVQSFTLEYPFEGDPLSIKVM